MAFENITAVIPVREGYDDIADNSLLTFGDVTLLEWKIMQLKHVLPAERIVLSTNSKRAMELAKPYGIIIARRADSECRDDIPFHRTVRGILENVKAEDVALCPCTAPLLGPKTYKGAFTKYNDNLKKKTHYSLTTVNEMREYLWDGKKPLNYTCNADMKRQRELPLWFRVTNGLYIMGRKNMLKLGYFLDKKPFLYTIDMLSGMDINYFDDYKITRELLSYYLSREAEGR